ncbi:MAG TPA: SDR family oxidoreductase [Aggregatilineales bacterium]|nr:SDR family oxidoreductase [Aggregatilineales bacterium]
MTSSAFNNGKPTALITGASGGIGLELARVFAREGHNLVLVARSAEKLEAVAAELSAKHGIQTLALSSDLAAPAAPQQVYDQVSARNIAVEVLVNNAGIGNYGPFHENDVETDLTVARLNMIALTHLTRLFLPGMVQRKRGRILNVASTAAFLPGPLMAVYYASKHYVLALSEALAEELANTGVSVSTLCPGPTRTEFQDRAAMQESKLIQSGMMEVTTVAEAGYRGLMAGQRVIVPGIFNQITAFLPRLLPRRLVTRMVMQAQGRVGH